MGIPRSPLEDSGLPRNDSVRGEALSATVIASAALAGRHLRLRRSRTPALAGGARERRWESLRRGERKSTHGQRGIQTLGESP